MLGEMLFLANVGVEVLRMDAVAFLWKRLGTSSENQPEAHMILQAYNALMQVAAPSVLFKSEAIVHPDEVLRYISPGECQISYNPLLMALLWESLATRKTLLLPRSSAASRSTRTAPGSTTCAVTTTSAGRSTTPTRPRSGSTPPIIAASSTSSSPAASRAASRAACRSRRTPRPATAASRVRARRWPGLEKALKEETSVEVELALRRILLIHGIILSIGGVPLIYLGDELGTLNNMSYLDDPAKADDSRWLHRPRMDWKRAANRSDFATIEGQWYQRLHQLDQSTPD